MIVGINARFLAAPLGGVQRFARSVTAQLLNRCEVALFTPHGVELPAEWAALAHSVTGGSLRGQLWEQVELPARALGRCDVLLSLANAAPLPRTVPQVVMVHDLLPLTDPQWFAGAFGVWYRRLMPRVIRGADAILTSSPDLVIAIRDLTGHDRTPISVVPQGCAPFDTPADDQQVAAVLGARGVRAPYVLAVGAGEPRKNAGFAMDVMRRRGALHGDDVHLVVVGAAAAHIHGPHPFAATGTAGASVLGRVTDSELHALYTGARALLYPTLGEGFGRPPLEALSCGTPVIASMYAQGEHTLAGTGARRLPLDVDLWQDALHVIIRTGERVGSDVRRRLRERWSWEATADAVLDACSAALSTRAALTAPGA